MVGVAAHPPHPPPPSARCEPPPLSEQDWPQVDVGNLLLHLDQDIDSSSASPMAGREQQQQQAALAPPPPPPRPAGGQNAIPAHNSGGNSGSSYASQEEADKSLKMKIKRTKSGRQEIVKAGGGGDTKMPPSGFNNGQNFAASDSGEQHSANQQQHGKENSGHQIYPYPTSGSNSSSPAAASRVQPGGKLESSSGGIVNSNSINSGNSSSSGAAGGSNSNNNSQSRNSYSAGSNNKPPSEPPPVTSRPTLPPSFSVATTMSVASKPQDSSSYLMSMPQQQSHHSNLPQHSHGDSNGGTSGGGPSQSPPTAAGVVVSSSLPSINNSNHFLGAYSNSNGPAAAGAGKTATFSPLSSSGLQQLTTKKLKVDVGTATEAATLTEPELLGPCEPGTAVNLEGIVWHETDTGVLVVNITWRGKTYVGTLLDCARHTNQWSAPRFTDSPEPGGKGRGKRARCSNTPSEPEPRKNLRSSKQKGKGGGKGGGSGNGGAAVKGSVTTDEFAFPAPSSPAKDGKRKKDSADQQEDAKKRKRTSSDSDESSSTTSEDAKSLSASAMETSSSSTSSSSSSSATTVPRREPKQQQMFSYKMLECPRKDCSKQYKHDEGLKWHLSHSHPEYIGPDGEVRDSQEVEREEQERRRKKKEDKEERRKKEQKGEGTPSKVAKLDTNQQQLKQEPPDTKPKVRPQLMAHSGTDDLKKKMMTDSPVGSPGVPPPLLATSPPAQQQQQAANSPAYSDISDDGDDSRSSNSKESSAPKFSAIAAAPASFPPASSATATSSLPVAPHGSTAAAAAAAGVGLLGPPESRTLPPTPQLVRTSSPSPRISAPGGLSAASSSCVAPSSIDPIAAVVRVSTPSSYGSLLPPVVTSLATGSRPSVATCPPPPSSLLPSSLLHASGPQPGTPEYHKYLAANGFPPYPYPYPLNMDPNYHVQLLKTDPVYKAKWEKDRAEREKAFKEQLDRDQGRYSGLSLVKEATGSSGPPVISADHQRTHSHHQSGSSIGSGLMRKPENSSGLGKAEDLRKREPSGSSSSNPSGMGGIDHRRPSSRASPGTISVKAEFREKEEPNMVKREMKVEEGGGIKPTMETRGPPPGPQTFGYMHHHHHPGLVPRPPYSLPGLVPPQFDPLFVTAGVSSLGPYGLPPHLGGPGHSPYLSPAHLAARPPVPFSFADPTALLRGPSFPGLSSAAADELVRAAGGSPGLSGTKALDLLQQHASQYYANQKLAELQERALKSPISSQQQQHGNSSMSSVASLSAPPTAANKPITTLAGKESPTPTSASDKAKSPPPLRHVHTHTHTHIGLGYPLLPPVPTALPPVGSLPPGALPPPPVGVPTAPYTGPSPYKPS